MIWNHVNEEKFMFQIGAIIPIVLTLRLFTQLINSFFMSFFVPSSNVNTTTCNSSNLIWWIGCLSKTIQILKKLEAKRLYIYRKLNEWINKSLIWWVNILYVWTFSLPIFHLDKFFFKKFLQVCHFEILAIYHCRYSFWKLKKVELVRNDFHKVQIVMYYCCWT